MSQIYQCYLCNRTCDDQQISLITGRILHHACYESLLKNDVKCDELFLKLNNQNTLILNKIQKANSIIRYIFHRIAGGEEINLAKCDNELEKTKENLEKIAKIKEEVSNKIRQCNDYWPTYPPDWDARKKEAKDKIGFCERCHTSGMQLHVHHNIPISKGGDHKLENLRVLCEACHSLAHGGQQFSYNNDNIESAFAIKIATLRCAIANNHMINFSYTRGDGRKSVRTLLPEKFVTIKNTLCVHGHCFLRREQRTFAIKRMTNLKHVLSIGKCYYLSGN